MNNLTATFEQIGVNEAMTLLQGNRNNRPVNKRNLEEIEAELKRGNFAMTGESIKVSKTGALIDGQHRLLAIVNAKLPQKISMLVVKGLEDESYKFIDTGRKRTASDVLAVQGVSNSTAMAAMAKFIINFNRGLYSSAAENHNKGKNRSTNKDISDFVITNKVQLSDSFKYGHNKENKFVNKGVLSSFHFITNTINKKDADYFCSRVADGSGLSTSSPIYQLRQRLLSDIRATEKLNQIHKIALICKAWNLYRDGAPVTSLKWNSIKEGFPKLK